MPNNTQQTSVAQLDLRSLICPTKTYTMVGLAFVCMVRVKDQGLRLDTCDRDKDFPIKIDQAGYGSENRSCIMIVGQGMGLGMRSGPDLCARLILHFNERFRPVSSRKRFSPLFRTIFFDSAQAARQSGMR